MKKFFENKPRAWFIIGSIFVLTLTALALLAGYLYKENKEQVDPNILVMVGSEAITKDDLKEKYYGIELAGDISSENVDLIEETEKDEENNNQRNYFIDLLVEESLINQYAEQNGVSVTDEEAGAKAKEETKEWENLSNFQQKIATKQHKNNLLREKTIDKIVTWKKGRYLEIRFDKNFALSDALSQEEKAERLKTQAKVIEEDRTYADKLKGEIYQKLTAETITFDEAMNLVREDKYIDYRNSDFTISDPGVDFDTLNAPEDSNLLERDSYKDVLKNTKKGEIAEPFLVQLDYGDWQKEEIDFRDSLWTILVVDDEYQGTTTSINQWFADKKQEVGVKSYTEGYASVEKISYNSSEALAWNRTNCTSGRYDQGLSHPGDLISEIRMFTAAGANVAVSGGRTYVRHGDDDAYAYAGCPLLGGYTIGDYSGYGRSEESDSSGCMYKFSSVHSSTFNLCCSGDHNPHQWRLRKGGTLEDKGYWDIRYHGTSTGSGWAGPYYSSFRTGYGSRYSASSAPGVEFPIINGKTYYRRGYWRVDPNINPIGNITYVTPSPQAPYGGTAAVSIKANATDPDPGEKVGVVARYKRIKDKNGINVSEPEYHFGSNGTHVTYGSSDNNGVPNPTTFPSTTTNVNGYKPNVSAGSWTTSGVSQTFPTVRLQPGTYDIYAVAVDEHWAYGEGAHVTMVVTEAASVTTGCDCRFDNPDGADNCGVYTNHVQANCTYIVPDPEISCTPTPAFGVAPRSIRFDITGTNLNTMNFSLTPGSGISPLDYTFNTGTPHSKTVFYTYNSAGEYDAFIRHGDFPGVDLACGVRISIENPGSGSGGEVAP